jgi:hypothetical protein
MLFIKQPYQKEVINHYEQVWDNKANVYLWDKGPFDKLPFDFRILEFAPTSSRIMWTYATCCQSRPEDKEPVELHMFSSVKDESLIELLTAVACYHRNTAKLGLNHTINFGQSWQNTSKNEYGFISLPYLDGPSLENLSLLNKKIVKFYWLIPISKEEADFKSKYGSEALEQKFDEVNFDYLNPNRESMI